MHVRGLSWTTVGRLLRAANGAPDERVRHVFLASPTITSRWWAAPPPHVQQERVDRWVREYPRLVAGLADSRGPSAAAYVLLSGRGIQFPSMSSRWPGNYADRAMATSRSICIMTTTRPRGFARRSKVSVDPVPRAWPAAKERAGADHLRLHSRQLGPKQFAARQSLVRSE